MQIISKNTSKDVPVELRRGCSSMEFNYSAQISYLITQQSKTISSEVIRTR